MDILTIDPSDKILIPIKEFAAQKGISRRTVNRYVNSGKLTAESVAGKTMIVQLPEAVAMPKKQVVADAPKTDAQETPESVNLPVVVKDTIFQLGVLTNQAKSRRTWQTLSIVSLVILVLVLIVALPGGMWLWMSLQTSQDDLNAANTTVENLTIQLEEVNAELMDSKLEEARLLAEITTLDLKQ